MAPRRRRISARRLPGSRHPAGLLLIALVVLSTTYCFSPSGGPPPPQRLQEGVYRVQRVVDGDTLLLANQSRVRLIGVDTPEIHGSVEPWGKEATEFTRRFVAGGEVRLVFDGRRTDQYGRVLAHVWVGGRMLCEELARAGLGRAEMKYSYDPAIKERLREAEAEARAAGRGIWSG